MMADIPSVIRFGSGDRVVYRNKQCKVIQILGFNECLLCDENSNELLHALLDEISNPNPTPLTSPDLSIVPEEDWSIAQKRFEIIRPLLIDNTRTLDIVALHAKKNNVHISTLYRWISLFEDSGVVSSLLPRKRNDIGTTRLDEPIESIIREAIEKTYLTKQRKNIQNVIREVESVCKQGNIACPHPNTIRNRIAALPERLRASTRLGEKRASKQFSPFAGTFPGADYPLSVVEIDHTQMDIILVDDLHRKPIGRPWITISIDVYSRMITGFYVSFDHPGALSTGLCIAHSILPKDEWLAKRGIEGEWPCWGLPAKIFVDNAKEFRGEMLSRACLQYGITLEWRPVARPHFGGHIERLIGTLMSEIHNLPGTTFSNIEQRSDYDSEGRAIFTLSEFESWFTTYIVHVYHRRIHTSLGIPPFEKYKIGILGDSTTKAVGLPPKVTNPEKLRLDFMPFVERTIQSNGIVVDDIQYFHDVMRKWINAKDPSDLKAKRKFIFRRDPRDISIVWFYDPLLGEYFPIPYRNTSHPPISVWELREIRKRITENGKQLVNEDSIFRAYARMQEIEEKAHSSTASANRTKQKKRSHTIDSYPSQYRNETALKEDGNIHEAPSSEIEITPFEDMDDYK
jgi:putative transposase